jgi:hypothetical protein
LSSVHSHVAVGPVSRPIRTAPGAFNLTNAAIASGSESTTPSRSLCKKCCGIIGDTLNCVVITSGVTHD